jgi:hypothetical protein
VDLGANGFEVAGVAARELADPLPRVVLRLGHAPAQEWLELDGEQAGLVRPVLEEDVALGQGG